MSSVDEQQPSERRPAGIGPGERLQAARIQKGFSLDDVASRMHLSPGILEAIEENNFDEITAPIFVKGYLRAYARIVELDEDEMIEQYMQYYSNEDPPISSTSNMAPELSVTDARIKWTTYLVVVVLAALLIAWWWNKEQNQEAPISLDTQGEQTQAATSVAEPVAASEIEALSESVNQSETAGDLTETSGTAAETSGSAAETFGSSTEISASPAETSAEQAEISSEQMETSAEPAQTSNQQVATTIAATEMESTATPSGPEPESAPETAATESAETAAPPAEVATVEDAYTGSEPVLLAPTGTDKMEIVIHADSWADIKDATDYQLVYDLLRAGQRIEITGSAPFAVFLGNGHGVEIRINGEEFTFSSRIRNDNTARLKVGG